MTDAEALAFWNELVHHFDGQLANPEHEPRRFMAQVKMYKYYKERRSNDKTRQMGNGRVD